MILAIALTVISLLVAAGLTWAGRLLHISSLDAQALAEKVAFPEPASALEWPELRVESAVPQPDELPLVIMQVGCRPIPSGLPSCWWNSTATSSGQCPCFPSGAPPEHRSRPCTEVRK